jgi:prephenate dehydrogenase
MTPDRDTVGVVGLGLIGGSIARDLAARGTPVAGYDADTAALDAACAEGIVRRLESDLAGLEGCSIVIVAVPVSATVEVLTATARHMARADLVTDVGSTKRSAVGAATSLGLGERFVGSHPMAGGHRGGWSASRTGLFAGATTYLCPTESTASDALHRAKELWTSLGARPRVLDAHDHDRRVAFTSHMPHAVSAALALALSNAKCPLGDLGPGGRDMLRIAGSSPELWTGIIRDNADAVRDALAALRSELDAVSGALDAQNEQALRGLLTAAQKWTGA